MAKKFKKLKNLFPVLHLPKTSRDWPGKRKKKNLVPNSVHTRPGIENSEKNSKKFEKSKKPLIALLNLPKTR